MKKNFELVKELLVESRELVQFEINGTAYYPSKETTIKLESGYYKVESDSRGRTYIKKIGIVTDELIRFEDKRYNFILEEVSSFQRSESAYKDLGLVHKRGILLFGPPGSGKSCLLKLIGEQIIKEEGIVFLANSSSFGIIVEGIKQFKEVEPTRFVMIIVEDIDDGMYNEKRLLEFFDGGDQQNNVLCVATTNYVERLSPRLLRAGRFDKKLLIDVPPYAGRLAYLEKKIGTVEKKEKIEEYARMTDNFSFGQLREFIVSVYCLKKEVKESIRRIRKGLEDEKVFVEDRIGNESKDRIENKGKNRGKDIKGFVLEGMMNRIGKKILVESCGVGNKGDKGINMADRIKIIKGIKGIKGINGKKKKGKKVRIEGRGIGKLIDMARKDLKLGLE